MLQSGHATPIQHITQHPWPYTTPQHAWRSTHGAACMAHHAWLAHHAHGQQTHLLALLLGAEGGRAWQDPGHGGWAAVGHSRYGR